MPTLSWRHHTLIQLLLSRGPLEEKEFHSIFSDLTGKNPGKDHRVFNDYLLNINKELSYVQFELRACRNQYDGNIYYGIVNNIADEQSKLGTKFTVPQIAFYRGIIEAIVHDAKAQGSITNLDALNVRLENQAGMGLQSQDGPSQVPPAFRNFSLSQKEKTLEELVRDKWLCSSPDGNIRLGVRSFLDLRSWFHNNDVPACEVCNEAGVKAEVCNNDGCTIRIHKYCLERKFSQRKVEKVCPGCGAQWPMPVSMTEANEEEDDSRGTSRYQPPLPSCARKKLRNGKTVGDDFVGCSSSQISMPNTDTRRTTRSSAQLR